MSSAALDFLLALALSLAPPPAAPPAPSQGAAAARARHAPRARPPGGLAGLLAACQGLPKALADPFRREYAAALPNALARAAALLEAAVRHHPELLDAMCFPSGLEAPSGGGGSDGGTASAGALVPAGDVGGKPAAGGAAGKARGAPPFSALDGLWGLLQNARALLQSSPRAAAAALGALSALWECQASAHGAVELLRRQTGFWDALKVRAAATHARVCVLGPGFCVAFCRAGRRALKVRRW